MGQGRPKVSILLLTYNHGKYIEDALRGILEQKADFNYEIVVADDCSTDGTREVVRKYQSLYPDRIRPRFNERNLGGKRNFITGYRLLDGEYVTTLDGDDCWCDSEKLRLQIEFLDRNPEFVGAAHNTWVERVESGQPPTPMIADPIKDVHTVDDLLLTSYFHTSSVVTRNVFNGVLPKSQEHPLAGDWFLSILYAEHGKFKYFDKLMSTYRIHDQGEWSQLSELQQKLKAIDSRMVYHRLLGNRYPHRYDNVWYAYWGARESLASSSVSPWVRKKYVWLSRSLDVPSSSESNKNPLTRRLYRLLYNAIKHLV